MSQNLLEGAKVRKTLVDEAFRNPNMTMGFEAEFYVLNAFKAMRRLYKKDTSQKGFWYLKKLEQVEWFDLLRNFNVLGSEGDPSDNQQIIKQRIGNLFRKTYPEAPKTKLPDMVKMLRKKHPMYFLMGLLKIYPTEGFEVDSQTQNALRKIIARGDLYKLVAYKNLEKEHIRLYQKGEDHFQFDPTLDGSQLEIFYHVLADALEEYLGEPVQVAFNPDENRKESENYTSWIVTGDASLHFEGDWDEGMIGIEIVSPVKQIAEGYNALHKVLLFLQNLDKHMPGMAAETNQSTALQINIGVAGAEVDYVKLLFLMGDEYLAQNYDRLQYNTGGISQNRGIFAAQTYFEMIKNFSKEKLIPILKQLKDSIKLDRQDIQKVIELFKQAVPKYKYYRVNLSKLNEGFVEFRVPGNTDYEDRWTDIRETVRHLAAMMQVATQPTTYRREFLTKLYKVAIEVGRKAFEELHKKKRAPGVHRPRLPLQREPLPLRRAAE